ARKSDESEKSTDDSPHQVATSARDLTRSARETAAPPASPSPVIETRLASLSSEALPRPLLNRTANSSTQDLAPATAAQTSGEKGTITLGSNNALTSIRQRKHDDTGAPLTGLPRKSVEIASTKPAEKRVLDAPAESSSKSKTENDD